MTDSREFRDEGVAFQYPADWELARQRKSGEFSVTVTGPGTAFATLVVFFGKPGAGDVVDTVVEAFQQDYDELDVYPARGRLCDRPTVAKDIEFFCHELTNTARVRAFDTDRCTVLLLCQTNDRELDEVGPIFDRIARTLSVSEAEMGFDDDDGGDDAEQDE